MSVNGGALEIRVIQVSPVPRSKPVFRRTKEVIGGLARIPAHVAVRVVGAAVKEIVHFWLTTPEKPVLELSTKSSFELPAVNSERALVVQDESFRRGFRMVCYRSTLATHGVSLCD